MKTRVYVTVLCGICWCAAPGLRGAEDSSLVVEEALMSGDLAQAEATLRGHLESHPKDDEVRFGLGITQILLAAERISHSLQGPNGLKTRFLSQTVDGARDPRSKLPPEAYLVLRRLIGRFGNDVRTAEATLTEVSNTDVKLRLHVGRIRFDFDGDGKSAPDETLLRAVSRLAAKNRGANQQEDLLVAFDRADVHWFRGQCHGLVAVCEFVLAYDWRKLLDHLYSAGTLNESKVLSLVDAAAILHLIDWPVAEPKRMSSALDHLKTMVRQFHQVHDAAEAETDDDHEWIAGPKQVATLSGKNISAEVFARRRAFLDEVDRLLAGKRLLPLVRHYPNYKQKRGVNVRRVFTEPRRFDLILWIQGSAAEHYLEEGDVNDEFWLKLTDGFAKGDWREFGLLPL